MPRNQKFKKNRKQRRGLASSVDNAFQQAVTMHWDQPFGSKLGMHANQSDLNIISCLM